MQTMSRVIGPGRRFIVREKQAPNSGGPRGAVDGHRVKVLIPIPHDRELARLTAVSGNVFLTSRGEKRARQETLGPFK